MLPTTLLLLVACGPSAETPAAGGTASTEQGAPGKANTAPIPTVEGEYTPADPSKFYKEPGYSPYAGRNYPTRPLWGDLHLHSGWSGDAGFSGTTLGPEEALRFARGEQVTASSGQPVQLSRPLDFVALTEHSDGMGVLNEIRSGHPDMLADPTVKRWHDMMRQGAAEGAKATMEVIAAQSTKSLPPVMADPRWMGVVWKKTIDILEQYNAPGRFTTIIGYEWTSNVGGGDNLHRNVIYRDGGERAFQSIPYTTFQSENPEDLWAWMAAYEKKTGGKVLAIPHNGNLSNGRMFEQQKFDGSALDQAWAAERAQREPLFEVAQMKGQSEAHPTLSPTDEFVVGYELWDRGNLAMAPKQPGMLRYEYLREALKDGMALEAKLGTNPFKYGIVAATDAHTGLTTAEEDNFYGKFVKSEPRPDRWNDDALKQGDRSIKVWEESAVGYTAVWATENSREAIFDALARREAYGSSGPRIGLRFFGGYDFEPSDATDRNVAIVGYGKGVAMGSDLKAAPAGKSPTFLVAALKDPIGANLDRIQIVKGWVDAAGATHEQIHDVVWSDAARRKVVKGRLAPVGSTVDVANATYRNTIGEPELVAVWKDPDFKADQRAMYYVRVLEIPTPRWTAYDAKYFKVKMAPEVPMTTQERAWSSPIWYTP
jgi:hypothetical protein